MDVHFIPIKQRVIRINGKQVSYKKSHHILQKPSQPIETIPKSTAVNFNNLHQNITIDIQKLPAQNNHSKNQIKKFQYRFQPNSTKLNNQTHLNASSFLSLTNKKPNYSTQTRPHSISQYEKNPNKMTDISIQKYVPDGSVKKQSCFLFKLKNPSALQNTIKPRVSSSHSQKIQLKNTNIENRLNNINFKNKQILNQNLFHTSSLIENCLTQLKKKEVTSYEQIQIPIGSIKSVTKQKNNQKIPSYVHQNVQKNKLKYFTECKDFHSNKIQEIKTNNFVDKNQHQKKKESFRITAFKPQAGNIYKPQIKQFYQTQKPKLIRHKRIESLFNERPIIKNRHQRQKSFDFNKNCQFQQQQQIGMLVRSNRQNLNSNIFSNQGYFINGNQNILGFQSEDMNGQERMNSSMSLEELNPVYKRQRQILSKYLKSLSDGDLNAHSLMINGQHNNKNSKHVESSCQAQSTIPFLDFVNQINQLQQQKTKANLLNKIFQIDRICQENQNFNAENSEKWTLQQIIKIGQNPQEIQENKMLSHVVTVWLKQMGYLKDENKFQFIHNVKKSLLNILNLSPQEKEPQMYNQLLLQQNTPIKQALSRKSQQNSSFLQSSRYQNQKNSNNLQNNLRRYSFDYEQTAFIKHQDPRLTGNSYQQDTLVQLSQKFNCGGIDRCLDLNGRRSLNNYAPTHKKKPSYFKQQRNSMQSGLYNYGNEKSIQDIIGEIYQNMYHKLVPVQLQLRILLNVCKRGWRFFQLLTVKVLREMVLHNKNNKNDHNSTFNNKQMGIKIHQVIEKTIMNQ